MLKKIPVPTGRSPRGGGVCRAGKTYALAKRYLNLLINPGLKPDEIPIKSILAITSPISHLEMKERILEFLKRLAFNEFEPAIPGITTCARPSASATRKSAEIGQYHGPD